ncbi:type 4 fimbriae expression regulatory protein PilR [Teredinibacter turnerae T7901]|uniref:Type 4 fimbriae expression regulatory protein PilR n=1 Tax=Teredinibacter turnerae (strain ATCC 39867 / T7901) TaxID=377629 RepID=C5BQY2_TERTT|nr:sigma-54 dependent transcriptional regulator [Teredinibacter turnerae]ACR14716.1 type 4 fimbriae expression regulatory protein PilR [Teredinibacter turnerae T7901]
MASVHALIIDDEPDIRELLEITLARMGVDVVSAANIAEAKQALTKGGFNICLTDMKLPDGNGIDLVRYIQKYDAELPVAVITAHGNMDTAIEAMKAGAFDFVSKPINLSALRKLIDTAITSNQLAAVPNVESESTNKIIGASETIISLKKSIKKLARSQAPVYISGESGSGKELVARSVHELGPRSTSPFVAVNCGAIPSELMESEFFGHKKGAFTGASQEKQGLFQAADGGTLFLDEVADLPLEMQVKLLRAIQEKAIRPIGGQTEISTNVRILSATHKNLEELVNNGNFRQDLFYRLNVIQLKVPALRERKSDIPLLVESLLSRIAEACEMAPPSLGPKALQMLMDYDYPGNIRELENILERAFTLCEEDVINDTDLQINQNSAVIGESSVDRVSKFSHYTASKNHDSIDDYLAEVEKEILCETLEHTRWNKTLAAKKLGISFRSLRYRLAKLGLDDSD